MSPKYRRNFPTTIYQRDVAEELGLEEIITAETSAAEASRLISATRNEVNEIRKSVESAKEIERNKQDLQVLLEQGLCVGCLAYYLDSNYPRWVRKINHESGMVICVTIQGKAHVKEIPPRFLKVGDIPEDFSSNPDEWHPAGYQKVPPEIIKKIQAGEFGEEIIRSLKARDLFLKNERHFYLTDAALKWIERMEAEEQKRLGQLRQEYEAKMDVHFCTQCGIKLLRPPDVSRSAWSKLRRCHECKTRPKVHNFKYCSRCGLKFFKTAEMGNKAWAGKQFCGTKPECFQGGLKK